MNQNTNKHKGQHLKKHQRVSIELCLNERMNLKDIGEELGKDPTTISKEIKRNRKIKRNKKMNVIEKCMHLRTCKKRGICDDMCSDLCVKCHQYNCQRICPDYEVKSCSRLKRFPHVCNGCEDKISCRLDKWYYRGILAHENYQASLVSSRRGIDMTKNQLEWLDQMVAPLILQGQSIAHIFMANKDVIPCSQRTLYNYVDQCLLSVRNIDLPRKVKYKPRKKKRPSKDVVKTQDYRRGRTYEDFKKHLKVSPVDVVEMDTVKGLQKKGEPSLLTFFFRKTSLMLAFHLTSCTQECVKETIDAIEKSIGKTEFKKLFPLILTDNGSEFKAPLDIEYDDLGNKRTSIFYCDPMASWQKGQLEKNHEYIRYILPKKTSFSFLNQTLVNRMINHINSSPRKSLNEKTPFEVAKGEYSQVALKGLKLELIEARLVNLKPSLIKK